MSQTLSDQQLQQLANYQNEVELDRNTCFYLLLTSIDGHQSEFSVIDFAVLQKESQQLLADRHHQTLALMLQGARNLITGKSIDDIDPSDFAQGMADIFQQLETMEENQNKTSLQRTLENLSLAGQTLIGEKITPPDITQGSHTKTRWQQMADETPALLKAMYAEALMQLTPPDA